jgi:hypothetical protein
MSNLAFAVLCGALRTTVCGMSSGGIQDDSWNPPLRSQGAGKEVSRNKETAIAYTACYGQCFLFFNLSSLNIIDLESEDQ